MEWFADEFNIETQEQYYKVKGTDIANKDGGGLCTLHGGSLYRLFSNVLPGIIIFIILIIEQHVESTHGNRGDSNKHRE
jgi:hypothetical protein